MKKRLIPAALMAVILAGIVRFTVFTDDCNLLVIGVTFLAAIVLSYGMISLVVMIRNRS